MLLVEDDADDAQLLCDAVRSGRTAIDVSVVGDGRKAVEYLRREGEFRSAARPDLILLDLHLPVKGGFEVLREIKGDAKLRVIPVITLTSSADNKDVWDAYEAGANCYVSKPVGLGAVSDLVRRLSEFWSVARLPPPGP